MPAGLDPNLVLFIRSAICSAWALQALLLMRARAGAVWTTGRLVGELKTHPKTVERVLRRFEAAGLIARQGDGFVWRPALPALEELSGAGGLFATALLGGILAARGAALVAEAHAAAIAGAALAAAGAAWGLRIRPARSRLPYA